MILGNGVAEAVASAGPAGAIEIGVTLLSDDLPLPGAGRRAAVSARQQRVLDTLPAGRFRVKRRYELLSGFAGIAHPAAIDALVRHPEVTHVYLDGRVHANLAQGVPLVGADTAHSLSLTGAGVNVAVLDTGIDTNHPDLATSLMAEQCFCDDHPSPVKGCCPGGGQTQSGSGSAEDDEGHGTSVAGIITSDGIAASVGVAPDAGIVAVKVLGAGGSGNFSSIAAALDWVLANRVALNIHIVNMSFSDGGELNNALASPCSGTNTANAIRDLHAAGVAAFAASGNDGHDAGISFPACVAEAISVAGVYDDTLPGVSWCGATCGQILCTDTGISADDFVCHANSGSLLDLLAPNWQTDSSQIGGGTVEFAGTSASAPYAAGQAALLLQADPGLDVEQLRALLTDHGPLVLNPDSGLSFPRSDVALALASFLGPCQDGIDNDGDNLTDSLEDPGCRNADWFSESPQCDDGIDNDGDGRTDLDDPQCGNAWQIREAQQSGCGLGFELIALIAPLSWLWNRSPVRRHPAKLAGSESSHRRVV